MREDGDERDGPPPPPSLASDADQNPPDVAVNSQLDEDTKGKDSNSKELGKLSAYKAGQSSEPSLTWVHVAPILSPRKACPPHEGTTVAGNNENKPVTAVPHPEGGAAQLRKTALSLLPHPTSIPKI